MPKYYKRSRSDGRIRKTVAEEAYSDNKFEAPKQESIGAVSETLQVKAFRELQNINVIDVHADPNTELSFGAQPYTIIGRTSQVIDATYPGEANISGNTIIEMQNNTTKSLLMKIMDVATFKHRLNYLYLPIKSTGKNKAVANEMIKSIEQAVSFGFSTMLTQLSFTTDTYATTDLPASTDLKSSKAYGYYAALIHYQTVLQSMVMPIAKYIELRSLEKELMRMSFRTEAPIITQIFGLFKKAAFISSVNTIGTVAINEYFDRNWYKQTNTLLCVPCRKTKGMVDPLLTMVGAHEIPNLTIKPAGSLTPDYNSADLCAGAGIKLVDPDDYTIKTVVAGSEIDFATLIERVCLLMSPAYILRFARLLNQGKLTTKFPGCITTASAYVEGVKNYFDLIHILAAQFSTKMSNVRTFLDKLSQSNLVYWTKGCSFFVDKIEQLEPKYNALVYNVIQADYANADVVEYDVNTKRWAFSSLWNKYTGIPEFDRKSGGSFLTFGLRSIKATGSDGQAIDFDSPQGLIPVLFSSTKGNLIVDRTGYFYTLSAVSLTNNDINTNMYLKRLNPLLSSSLSAKIPQITVTEADSGLRANVVSNALQFLGNTFGYGRTAYSTTYSYAVDPDLVAFTDAEIEDVTNQMIVFARNYAPFRVDTPDASRTIGFAKVS